MIALFGSRVFEGYLAPRRSARRLLQANPGWRSTLTLGLLAFALQVVFSSATNMALRLSGSGPEFLSNESFGANAMGSITAQFGQHAGILGLASVLAYWVGRVAGGKGAFWSVAAAVAWHSVVTAFLAPLYAIGFHESGSQSTFGGLIFLFLALSAVTIWLLANYLAEAHGFHSAFKVALAIFGVGLVVGAVLVVTSSFPVPA